MKIYINASNLHVGGGKVILTDFISATNKFEDIEFIIYVDSRFEIDNLISNNVVLIKIKKKQRFFVYYLIEKKLDQDDIVVYLTNIPPILKHKCKTVLVQSNRFVIDKYPLSGFSPKTKFRIQVERFMFWLNKKNFDFIIVQSESMGCVLQNCGILRDKIKIIAYIDNKISSHKNHDKHSNREKCFLYVSSDDPHKNHKTLIESWCLLAKESIYPKLIVTIEKKTKLHKYIDNMIIEFNLNIEVKPKLQRTEVLDLYSKSTALIFPSFFESYGLPLVEAVQNGLPVLASELDYVRDILDPVETFDPNSAKSISRSVKRFLKLKGEKTVIVAPEKFIDSVINL
jgi:glycosyltransferase involved in cell wall biosynthesis